jgi:hypothetical protein
LLTVPCHLTLLAVHSPGYCHVPRWWLLHHQYQPQQQYQQRLQQEEQALLTLPGQRQLLYLEQLLTSSCRKAKRVKMMR